MKNLSDAIKYVGGVSKLAKLLGVTPQAVCFWRDGLRKIPPEKCSDVERVTHGTVTRRHLRRADWHLIWPELAHLTNEPMEKHHE
ncbi:MAG: helix-turn-helix domain-containing protein [Burkholderiaceae bacterium]|jgi:DNA-binding transcriptional regulator YdaS (Cro superfamily)|nr:helix-turn-helix domain-containing protein [Burkholderiaceae bacterium]